MIRGTHSDEQLALVERQIAIWTAGVDSVGALGDWTADGVLTAPRGVRLHASEVMGVIEGWHREFCDLRIELTSLVSSADGAWLAIEWTWNVTRRSDGKSSAMFDAIIVELADGLIVQWREYFDTFDYVEFDT